MRNRIAGFNTGFTGEPLDERLIDETMAKEFARWTPAQRRVRRMFARMQRRRIRRILRVHSAPVAMEGARDAEATSNCGRADSGDSAGFRADPCDADRGARRAGLARLRGGLEHRGPSRRALRGDGEGRGPAAGRLSPIASAHDRQPGDAEADGAFAELEEQRGLCRGDLVLFVDPERGFRQTTAAWVIQVTTRGDVVVETCLERWEMLVSQSQIVRRLPS